jgi:hypothetical protein
VPEGAAGRPAAVGWAGVATKRDLEHLEARIDFVEARLEAKFEAALERSLREQANRFLVGNGLVLSLLLAIQELLTRL